MHAAGFIQDLAVIMLVAGAVTVLFHRLRQPVVLGYIVAGVIIGPHTPPFSLVNDDQSIRALAELGVVFLMFSLGLEFSLRKLARVGPAATAAALCEIVLMGWAATDRVYLGAILAMSSTTIIIKVLDDLGLKDRPFAHLAFGILIVEDILGIAMIALLSAIAATGTVGAGAVLGTLGKLALFMTVAAVLGFLIVPRLLAFVARFDSDEMLLVTVLGLAFGFCLLVVRLDYSVALGAFVIGAVMAESRQLRAIERLVRPLRDMFSAIFFVTIGMLLDPRVLTGHALPIAVITLALLLGKTVSCTLGAFLAGSDARTALRAGMSLAQIGEFSFIIAALGMSLGVIGRQLYPVAVAVSVVTTFLTPYLIRSADRVSGRLAAALPPGLARVLSVYSGWLRSIRLHRDRAWAGPVVRRSLVQVMVNTAFAVAAFVAGAALAGRIGPGLDPRLRNTAAWGGALLVSLPFLIAAYRKLQAVSMILAELAMEPGAAAARYGAPARRVVSEVIPAAYLALVLLLVAVVSAAVLPPLQLLLVVLLIAAGLTTLLWRWFVRMHSRLQAALLDTFHKEQGATPATRQDAT
ncbi:cation:proton antiporter [bacterium]|nr:cation:proton antiporter [bacterium]